MIEFQWAWVFWLLPLPLVMKYLFPPAQPVCGAAIRIPFYAVFSAMSERRSRSWISSLHWHVLIAYVIWVLLILALGRPQWVEKPQVFPVSGRDLMLAVDISGSMKTQDFTLNEKAVSRLKAVKHVASTFIDRRKGDRIGLILFGSKAYLQAPLTFDTQTVKTLLMEAEIGWAGKDTAIGDAIGMALKRLKIKPEQSKILILLTDGTNTAGISDPFQAATFAQKHGLTLYTIGVGASRVKLGLTIESDQDESYLDEQTLEVIARITGGQYFKADNTVELETIYQKLQEIEPSLSQGQYRKTLQSLYFWPLSIAFILSLLLTRLLMATFSVSKP